ncbi:MAG: glutamate-1-semialdehyde 2,1-aminomutase [candidate division Zixibacteria bacterium]|nr:glutamate-1-semialdehyde 2,1-aminomutase [candidate division Zixibacteria bacterium]
MSKPELQINLPAINSDKLCFDASLGLQEKFHWLIPGGGHTYAKADDQYPVDSPIYLTKGLGCHVWDADGNEYIEYGMGLRTVTLGHAYPSVIEAAHRQMQLGSNFSRPGTIELQCAEKALSLFEGAEMIKFSKNGSDVTTGAVKLSRAYTGRDMVAVCADHPFFATNDWFIGSTPMNSGIPQSVRDLTHSFRYNDPESLEKLFALYPGKIACVILEAETTTPPQNNFLQVVQRLCQKNGAVFILDEIITGFRWSLGGAQKVYGIQPDLSTWGKGMGNGFAIAALTGKREIMDLGGIGHDKERVFLLSTTHGAEHTALAAALEVFRVYETENVIDHLHGVGTRLTAGINAIIRELKLDGCFEVIGKPSNLTYATRDEQKRPSQAFRTLFLQETIARGILAPSLVVSFSHTDEIIDKTLERMGDALFVYKKALDEGIEKYLHGRPVKPVFRKHN